MEFGNSNDLRDPYLNAAIVACYKICMVIGMSINHHTMLWLIMLRPIEAFESFKLNTLDYHCFSIFVTILRFLEQSRDSTCLQGLEDYFSKPLKGHQHIAQFQVDLRCILIL